MGALTKRLLQGLAMTAGVVVLLLLSLSATQASTTSLRLLHWNVADYNPGGDTTPKESHKLATETIRADLLSIGERIGGPPDVITLNEDVEFSSASNALSLGSAYVKAGTCRAEELWRTEPAYANGGRFLQNTIWVRTATWRVDSVVVVNVSSEPATSDSLMPLRCAVMAHLRAGDAKVSIAAVHLTGGRFTDEHWETFAGQKAKEVRAIATNRPDVVVGDLNSYWSGSDMISHQGSYEPYIAAKQLGNEAGYVRWGEEGVRALKAHGYRRLPIDHSSTTRYGGVVDHIFMRRASVVSAGDFMGVVDGGFLNSDHQPIHAELRIWPARPSRLFANARELAESPGADTVPEGPEHEPAVHGASEQHCSEAERPCEERGT